MEAILTFYLVFFLVLVPAGALVFYMIVRPGKKKVSPQVIYNPSQHQQISDTPKGTPASDVPQCLHDGTLLYGVKADYVIKQFLGQGSFGITYLAYAHGGKGSQSQITPLVAIKEFYMRDVNGRVENTVTSGTDKGVFDYYKKKFIGEAVLLSQIEHTGIVKVVDQFEANNTFYYVMEYIEGGSLSDMIDAFGRINENDAIGYMTQVGNALSYMHSNKKLHLDIKPSNIMLRKNGEAVVIDFGLSKQYNPDGIPESSTSIGGGTPGYAPLEQSQNHSGKDFPVTMDVYALGATMFKMLTGVRPPEAPEILNSGFPAKELQSCGVSPRVISCIEKAMDPLRKNRYQSVDAFISALNDRPAPATLEVTEIIGYRQAETSAHTPEPVVVMEPEVHVYPASSIPSSPVISVTPAKPSKAVKPANSASAAKAPKTVKAAKPVKSPSVPTKAQTYAYKVHKSSSRKEI